MTSRRYQVKITRSGYIYIAVTIFLSVAAINTGNNLLYLISSLMLALMALSGVTSFINLLFLDISLGRPFEVFADIPARFNLSIKKRVGTSFFLRCESLFGSTLISLLKNSSRHSIWLKFSERGRTTLDNLKVHSGFPLGLFRRFRIYPVEMQLIVYPKPLPCLFLAPSHGRIGSERKSDLRLGELGDEIKELRDFRTSDPIKWVEWKATARRGRMMVRDFYHMEGDTLVIDLSRKTGAWEKKISEACFLVQEGYRRKLSVALKMPDLDIKPGNDENHRKLLLEALSLA